ncbi:flavodoxin family protein [Fontibacillus sp. BL9]|uniref:flavodoxin family protein n=1 Tax=Fontibacillus sp. BL9 TaxID=3389971 RepID=UPI003978264C
MNIAVVSYSYTGNNDLFAACVAKDLSATHIKITTKKPMTMGSIITDMIFARTPKMQPSPKNLKQYDLILFFAPIWMGHIASPLREYLQHLKSSPQAYGFFSVSGGADGGNPKLFAELVKRTGKKPAIVLDQHIRDFIPQNLKPTRHDTSAYKISEAEASRLSTKAVKEINRLTTHN